MQEKLILCGTVTKGTIEVDQTLYYGPDNLGKYKEIRVTNIKRICADIDLAEHGDTITVEVESTDPS